MEIAQWESYRNGKGNKTQTLVWESEQMEWKFKNKLPVISMCHELHV